MAGVFQTFLRLGLTSFGGPTAHLGYFRREFVERAGWIDEATFAGLVAFCSVLPGPTSSQVGMLIGLIRGGAAGAFLAWLGFTAPSAIALTALALALRALEATSVVGAGWFTGLLTGLTAAAAAVVAQAVQALARSLCPDRETQTVAIGAAILTIALGQTAGLQWMPIALGALAGTLFMRRSGAEIDVLPLPFDVPRSVSLAAGALFILVVAALFVPVRAFSAPLALVETVARAGSLVFGGGHVVLPLLQSLVDDGLVDGRTFFAGYGLTQAMPGPLFTFAAFLGAANTSPLTGVAGALVATVVIFVPSFALVFALAPGWNGVRALPGATAALRGANAAVVGLLGGVLYHPILTSLAAHGSAIAVALAAYALVAVWKVPPWIVVAISGGLGALAGAVS